MRKISLVLAAAALAFVLAPNARATDGEAALAEGKVHSSLRAAVAASALTLDEPLVFKTRRNDSVWVLEVTGLTSGKVDTIRVHPGAPIGAPSKREMAERYALNVVGGTTRCTIELYDGTFFGTLIQVTDMDWNNLGEISGVNDKASSLKTGCNPVWFYSDKNFAGSVISYVPANTNLSSLGDNNNRISSLKHDLP